MRYDAPDVKTPPRRLLAAIGLALAAAALPALAACGGGGGGNDFEAGRLTDPRNVPTVTPWQQPPEPTIIDPNAIVPISGGGTPVASATPEPGEPGVCGDTYTIQSGDTLYDIAVRCGVDFEAIKEANPEVDPTALHPGQVINVPVAPEASP